MIISRLRAIRGGGHLEAGHDPLMIMRREAGRTTKER